jgi:hypothetical protein
LYLKCLLKQFPLFEVVQHEIEQVDVCETKLWFLFGNVVY